MSPASLVTGVANPDYNSMRIEFGAYVQVFEDNAPSNTLRARSLGAIALAPTGNAQGDCFFSPSPPATAYRVTSGLSFP